MTDEYVMTTAETLAYAKTLSGQLAELGTKVEALARDFHGLLGWHCTYVIQEMEL